MTPGIVGPFVRYDEAGQITEWGRQEVTFTREWIAEGRLYLEAEGGPDFFVEDGEVRPRAENPAVLDGMSIKNLPKPSWVKIGTENYEVTDGKADLSFDLPGTYTVTVTSLKHLPATFEVSA